MEFVNTTPFRIGRAPGRLGFPKHSLSFVVKGAFRLAPGAPAAPLPEDQQLDVTGDIFHDDDQIAGLKSENDFAPVKPLADLTLTGSCHAPGDKPVQAIMATFKVGDHARTLAIFGDRVWRKKMLGLVPVRSDPEPFVSMPLRYDRAYGGPGVDANPIGRGAAPEKLDGVTVHRLPNIEDPSALIESPSSKPVPVGFAPIFRDWRLRRDKLGTYTKRYVKERWPWYPADFDPTYFNAAPAWLQVEHLKGDEPLLMENLHPEHALYESRLPGLRVRCYVRKTAPRAFEEVPMVLDTLWVDMDQERLVLTWRGHIEVTDEDAEEVEFVFVEQEPLEGAPIPNAESRMDAALQDMNETPAFEPEAPPEPDLPEPAPPEPAGVDEALAAQIDAVAGVLGETGAAAKENPAVDSPAAFQQAGFNPDIALLDPGELGEAPPAVEPPGDAPMDAASIQEMIEKGEAAPGVDLSGAQLDGVDLGGQDFSGTVMADASLSEATLENAKLVEADLSGADLSGAAAPKADLSGADLSGASLAGADLTGANLAGAVLDGADLTGATLTGADFTGASLAEANLANANLIEATLDNATLAGADITGADMTGASMIDTAIDGAHGEGVVMADANAFGLRASGARLPGLAATGLIAERSTWTGAELPGADFSEATLSGADFSRCRMSQASLQSAIARQACFRKADLTGADLRHVDLFEGSLERACLRDARVDGANFFGADFHEADTTGAVGDGANVTRTKLEAGA